MIRQNSCNLGFILIKKSKNPRQNSISKYFILGHSLDNNLQVNLFFLNTTDVDR